MKIPQLAKKPEKKSCHGIEWEDNYSWIHQKNILEVLKDGSKLIPEVRDYLEKENAYTEFHLKDTKEIQKKLFDEIKGRIKLDDESLPFKDLKYFYWTKTTEKGNYSIKLRKKIGTDEEEEIWNGDKEKNKLKTEYFGVGDLEVSWNDEFLGYSLDLKGSEYYTIFVRNIKTEKFVTEEAYNNPKFVEDIIRDLALSLNKDERVSAYKIESENFESIHNHSAYAFIEKDKTKECVKGKDNVSFLKLSQLKSSCH